VPSIFARIEDWWGKQPEGINPFTPDVTGHDIVNVELEVGGLLVFNSLITHTFNSLFNDYLTFLHNVNYTFHDVEFFIITIPTLAP
jgi:hypothetical protein